MVKWVGDPSPGPCRVGRFRESTRTPDGERDDVSKKEPVVKITTPDAAGKVAGLSLEATVVMADVAAATRGALLALSTAAGLVVMHQMLAEELAGDRRPGATHTPGLRARHWCASASSEGDATDRGVLAGPRLATAATTCRRSPLKHRPSLPHERVANHHARSVQPAAIFPPGSTSPYRETRGAS